MGEQPVGGGVVEVELERVAAAVVVAPPRVGHEHGTVRGVDTVVVRLGVREVVGEFGDPEGVVVVVVVVAVVIMGILVGLRGGREGGLAVGVVGEGGGVRGGWFADFFAEGCGIAGGGRDPSNAADEAHEGGNKGRKTIVKFRSGEKVQSFKSKLKIWDKKTKIAIRRQ